MSNWDLKCQKKCGRCCIICTDIQLTKEEVKEAKYKMKKRNGKGKLNGWSGMILKRKKAYMKELKRDVYVCFYFNPDKIECTIYEDRPTVCHNFSCEKDKDDKETGININRIWNKILKGKDNYLCFDA